MKTTPFRLLAKASTTSAEKDRPARIEIVAYTGGIIVVSGWGPVVIDLSGLEAGEQVPLLADHVNELANVIGFGKPEIAEGRVIIRGNLTRATEAGKLVIGLAGEGVPLQASVGVQPGKVEDVRSGQTVQVNGQIIEAPKGGFALVRQGRLQEVSLTPAGADAGSEVSIAARRKLMGEDEKVETTDPVEEIREREAAESGRIAAIRTLCAKGHAEIEAKAIAEGWDGNRTELEILRASRTFIGNDYRREREDFGSRRVQAAAVLMHLGRESLAEKSYGPEACEVAHRLRPRHFLDLVEASLKVMGLEIPASREEMIRASFSTTNLPTALGDGADKILQAAYNVSPGAWRKVCRIQSVPNFREHTMIRPVFGGNLDELPPDGAIKHTSLKEETARVQVGTFAKLLRVTRTDVVNDDLGVFVGAAEGLGRMSARSVADLWAKTLLLNTGDFFGEANGNLLSGETSPLSLASLGLAVKALRDMTDGDGNVLDLIPGTLLVPTALEETGRSLITSELIQGTGEEETPTGNAWRGVAELAVESRLSAAKFENASSTGWYLFSTATDGGMVAGFLNGRQSPTIEALGLQADVSTLGYAWRVYFDYGFALSDPRCVVFSAGA